MNAGSSAQGREFAARNCDFLLTVMIDPERGPADVAHIQALAQARYQRELAVFTTTCAVCRPTRRDAKEYRRQNAVTHADGPAVERLMQLQGMPVQSFPPDMIDALRVQFAGGDGVYPLLGDPDFIAEEIARIHRASYAGATLTFVD